MDIVNKVKKMASKDRIVLMNIAGAFLVKGAALLVSLFTMPAYMRYFSDQEVLGVWFTVLSVISWILNFDLGIGNGLRNNLTLALAQKNDSLAREYISSAYILMGVVVAFIAVLGWVAIPLLNWSMVFNISPNVVSSKTLSEVMQFAFLGIMLQFYLRLISSVLYALQYSSINNFISLITSILHLLFVLVAPSYKPEDNLRMFSIAHIVCVNLPLLITTVVIFNGKMRNCRPSAKSFQSQRAKQVLSLGGVFFVCQILYMVITNTNEFFITQYSGPADVVEYQIYNRLFSLASTLFMLALTPVWSAVSKAIAERDFKWIDKLHRNLNRLSLLAALSELLMIPFLQWLVNIWLGDEAITINWFYAMCFAMFGTTMIYQSAISTITNGAGRMKIQAVCYSVGVLSKFAIVYIGFQITNSWIVVILANTFILIPYCIIQELDIRKYIAKGL